MRHIGHAVLVAALACGASCDGGPPGGDADPAAVPAGWRSVTALAGGGRLPAVSAALPGGLERTGEVGIDSQSASFEGAGLRVRFDYGASAHPGCPAEAARCTLRDAEIAGRPARLSVAQAGGAGRPAGSVHTYFVAPADGAALSNTSSGGGGLLLTVTCTEAPACRDAERIAATVRLSGAR